MLTIKVYLYKIMKNKIILLNIGKGKIILWKEKTKELR